jgi:amino acid adenylation domain-containing protein
MVDDTPALVVGLLGILKSGNTFVPVNPLFPDERIHFIINDCNIAVLVTDNANYPKALQIAKNSPVIRFLLYIDHITGEVTKRYTHTSDSPKPVSKRFKLRKKNSPSPCYVIYTSGSTGKPKGVPITHRNLVPLLLWFRDYFGLGAHTRVMHNLSYTFDFGVFEVLTTLFFGGILYILNKREIGDFAFYPDFFRTHAINTVHTTPAFFSSIVSTGKKMPSLELLHLGGENLTGSLVARISELVPGSCRIYNGYGPTEATINCSIFSITTEQRKTIEEMESIPIGKPTANNGIYILDKYHRLQPVGVVGELCVSGEGLAEGYLNRSELTAEKFDQDFQDFQDDQDNNGLAAREPAITISELYNPTHPTHPLTHSPIYRTGDLACWLPDGNIEFLGRIDHQVKIRGFRIELGEIENYLLKHEDIKEAVVISREDETRIQRYLCAYIVQQNSHGGEELTVSDLREYLLKELPDYMVPAYFIHVEKIPLTPNGKIDRKALPEPAKDMIKTGAKYAAPANKTEEKIVEIWQAILGIERIGVEDDFFQLGGDSILASQCIARIREEFQVNLSLRKIFEQPLLKALSKEVINQKQEIISLKIKKVSRNGDIPLSFAQERLWFLQKLDKNSMAYFVPRAIRIFGKLEVRLLERTFTELIRRHEILRTVFPTREGRPVQRILESYPFKLPLINFTGLDEKTQSEEVSLWISQEGQRPFDLEKGPLLRVSVLKLKKEEHIVVLTEHHLIHDGWTQGVLLREFIAVFTAYLEGKPSPLPELPIQYADFAFWQRDYLQGDVLKYHLDYWRKKLSGLAPFLELPSDRPRPAVISGQGGLKISIIPSSLTAALKEFNKKENVTLFMTMLAVFNVFLYRYTGVEDLCVGTGVANRRLKEMEGMLGMVINTLALRTRVSGELSFREYLQRVKETCLEAYEHEDTPFDKIVEAVQPERSLGFTPIFQVMFSFMDTPTENLELPGLELILEESHNRSSKFDLNLVAVPPAEQSAEEGGGEILIEWEYNSDLFDEDTIDDMSNHYKQLLEETIHKPKLPISELQTIRREAAGVKDTKENLRVEFNF